MPIPYIVYNPYIQPCYYNNTSNNANTARHVIVAAVRLLQGPHVSTYMHIIAVGVYIVQPLYTCLCLAHASLCAQRCI